MRIVVVSAHYPPNFVSGGTLQPQRLAQALAARGHEMSVFAGWLDDGQRVAGSSWDAAGGDGLPIRWVAVTPWTSWSDDRNFDNPTVSAQFAAYLAAVRPDVVHLHSIQTLGAGLLPVAKASGAAVVVTMHDFWWCCARQFLVEPGGKPCSVVVDAGVCLCAKDRGWLEDRNRWLRSQLAAADVVLGPSAPAVAVLAANGVRPDRVLVDENGMPALEPGGGGHARRRSSAGLVRFLYAGGPDEMKGVHVLVGACLRLADTQGWTVRAFGAEPWLAANGVDLGPLPFEAPAPFEPAALDAVLAEGDVLVIPSVMRESHSLLTREALLRGVPVICSDCLGPEEVVVDGRNGLVVPTGDDELLAAAMRRLIGDPGLLQRLAAGTDGVAVRSLDAQVDALEARFNELVTDRRSSASSPSPSIRRVLFIVGIDGAPLRYRAWLPIEALALHGVAADVRWFTDPDLDELAAVADAVVVYRVPATHWVLEVVEQARHRGTPVLFDVDDLVFDPGIAAEIPALTILDPDTARLWLEGVHRYRTTMEACDVFIASTPLLARHAAETTALPVERFDNGVGVLVAKASDRAVRRPRTPGPLRIGYFSGTDTHDHDWALVEPAVCEVLRRRDDVELWLGGHLPEVPALAEFGDRVKRLPFVDWRHLPALLRDVDVNLCPLVLPSRFNEAKSAIKWLEAALVATPTVASPTEPIMDAIDDGANGLLATGTAAWVEAIERLLDDRGVRARIGNRARRDALLRWSPHLQGARYLAILERARTSAAAAPRPPSSWTPVVVDEAVRRRPIEAYVESRSAIRRAAIRARYDVAADRYRALASRARASIATDGVAATAAKVPRWVAGNVRRVARR